MCSPEVVMDDDASWYDEEVVEAGDLVDGLGGSPVSLCECDVGISTDIGSEVGSDKPGMLPIEGTNKPSSDSRTSPCCSCMRTSSSTRSTSCCASSLVVATVSNASGGGRSSRRCRFRARFEADDPPPCLCPDRLDVEDPPEPDPHLVPPLLPLACGRGSRVLLGE